MSPLVAILILLLAAAVILVVAAPLRARGSDRAAGSSEADAAAGVRPAPVAGTEAPERAELEAAREAKYREIRDSELDYRTGKLSAEDYAAVDTALRAEALEILNRLERLDAAHGDAGEERA